MKTEVTDEVEVSRIELPRREKRLLRRYSLEASHCCRTCAGGAGVRGLSNVLLHEALGGISFHIYLNGIHIKSE